VPTDFEVMEALKEVVDPDIHMNIVDLGLVYSVAIEGADVNVTMTLTTPACPVGPQIMATAEAVVGRLEGVEKVSVNLVWEPAWNPGMMSDTAKLELGYEI
jgi:metal-sulfur cluster biosynthetic enzyme